MFDIVMPLFNKEAFVAATIESVIAQRFGDWRLFVVDDGSKDASVAVVERFNDGRIQIIRQENAGPGVARNTGIAAGRSEWIAFLDADDIWLPDHLEELDRLRKEFADAALIGAAFVPWSGGTPIVPAEPASITRWPVRYFHELAHVGPPFYTSSAAFGRRAVEAVGPLEPVVVGDETELWVRLALHGPVAASNRPTVLYRVGTGGITDSDVRRDIDASQQLDLRDISLPVATAVERLDGTGDSVLKSDLIDFIDYEVGIALLKAVREGRITYARELVGLFINGPIGKARVAAKLARLPRPWGRRAMLAIFALKRAGRGSRP